MVEDVNAGTLSATKVSTGASTLELKADDFDRIPALKVRVTHMGKPVSAMSVIARQADETQRALLTPSDKGEITFFGLRVGELNVRLEGKSKGEPISPPIEQRFEVKPKSDPLEIAVSQEVDTVDPVAVAKTDETPGRPASEPDNPLGRTLLSLVFLAATAALVLFAYRWVKSNSKQVDQWLKKAGIEIPKDNVDPELVADDNVPDPVIPAVAAPPSQIMLPPDSTVAAPSGALKLVGELGQTLVLPDGVHQVTREPGSPLSIQDPSISRAHARLTVQNGNVSLTDEGSTNGTFVNGNRIDSETPVRPGDTIQFGTRRFRLES